MSNNRERQIVVLDGYTLNPGDLTWDALQVLGSCHIYDRTPRDQIVDRARGAEIVLTNKALITAEAIGALAELRYIGVLATGYNVVDIGAARSRGIMVTNVPAYGTPSVAQMVFAHILNITQRVADHAAAVRRGDWTNAIDWCFWNHPLMELHGLTLGLVGCGDIGIATASIAQAFGMRVIACHRPSRREPPPFIQFVDIETLFREADIVSLHCPLTDETRGLVNAVRLSWMKPTAILINTGRGPLIDEQALADALNRGQIAAAGVDVLEVEPPPADNPLLSAKNCFITPHIAWATRAARARLLRIAIDNIEAFLRNQPQNVV